MAGLPRFDWGKISQTNIENACNLDRKCTETHKFSTKEGFRYSQASLYKNKQLRTYLSTKNIY